MTSDDTRTSLNRALQSVSDAQTRYHIRSALQRLAIPTVEDQDEHEIVAEE